MLVWQVLRLLRAVKGSRVGRGDSSPCYIESLRGGGDTVIYSVIYLMLSQLPCISPCCLPSCVFQSAPRPFWSVTESVSAIFHLSSSHRTLADPFQRYDLVFSLPYVIMRAMHLYEFNTYPHHTVIRSCTIFDFVSPEFEVGIPSSHRARQYPRGTSLLKPAVVRAEEFEYAARLDYACRVCGRHPGALHQLVFAGFQIFHDGAMLLFDSGEFCS